MTKKKFDVIIVLGGGRNARGNLTELSLQRLDKGVELYLQKKADKVMVVGGHGYVWSNDIRYKEAGAKIRKEYLIKSGIPEKNIIVVEKGGDTIVEAFASRKVINKLTAIRLLLVTSDKHMKRALWLFKRIYGNKFIIKGVKVPCGDLLNENEEKEYFQVVKKFFSRFPRQIPDPNLETWSKNHKDLYKQYKRIHDRYHPPGGPESQAYMGVRKKRLSG